MGSIVQRLLSSKAGRFGLFRAIYIGLPALNLLLVLFDSLYLRELPYSDRTLRDLISEVWSGPLFYDRIKGISTSSPQEWLDAYSRLRENSGSAEEANSLNGFERAHHHLFRPEMAPTPQFASDSRIVRQVALRLEGLAGRIGSGSTLHEMYEASPDQLFEVVDREIVPLVRRAYLRSLDEKGNPVDLFYKIDRWFGLYFLIEFSVRWISALYRRGGKRGFLARNWADIFLMYPPQELELLRYLRIVPLYFRIREVVRRGALSRILNEGNQRLAESLAPALYDALFLYLRTDRGGVRTGDDGRVEISEQMKAQLKILTERVLPSAHAEITEFLNYSSTKAAESWLLSPFGPIARFLLVNFNIAVKDAVEAALLTEKGRRRLRAVLERVLIETARVDAPERAGEDKAERP